MKNFAGLGSNVWNGKVSPESAARRSMSEPLDTSNFCKCKYKLKIVHQNRMDREPMVLQELPKGLHTYISLPRYASMKSHVDNVLLQVFVIARRLHLLTWLSSCILVLSIMSYFGLLLVHIEEDCDEMLGYMLPVVCPAVCFWAHWMLHKYRRQRCSDELEAALKQLRGLLAWENQKFNGIKLLLKSNLKFNEPHPKELDAHIEVTFVAKCQEQMSCGAFWGLWWCKSHPRWHTCLAHPHGVRCFWQWILWYHRHRDAIGREPDGKNLGRIGMCAC